MTNEAGKANFVQKNTYFNVNTSNTFMWLNNNLHRLFEQRRGNTNAPQADAIISIYVSKKNRSYDGANCPLTVNKVTYMSL